MAQELKGKSLEELENYIKEYRESRGKQLKDGVLKKYARIIYQIMNNPKYEPILDINLSVKEVSTLTGLDPETIKGYRSRLNTFGIIKIPPKKREYTKIQNMILKNIEDQGPLTAKELANILNCSITSVRENLIKFEQEGKIKRFKPSAKGIGRLIREVYNSSNFYYIPKNPKNKGRIKERLIRDLERSLDEYLPSDM